MQRQVLKKPERNEKQKTGNEKRKTGQCPEFAGFLFPVSRFLFFIGFQVLR